MSIKVVAGAVKTGQARSEPEGDGWRLLINQFSAVQPQYCHVVKMLVLTELTDSISERMQKFTVFMEYVRRQSINID